MPTVSALGRGELERRLAGPGVCLETGPFITRLRSPLPQLADTLGLLYADYRLCECTDYADFNITLRRAGGLRRWIRPQVNFDFDGATPFQPLPLAQAFPMFEWVLNWCISMHAHRYLIIHAAVVEKDGQAAILAAPPGSGKSTLCAALVAAGWRLLSDELAMVRLDDGMLEPVPRPISLKNGSIDVIRRHQPGAVISNPVADTIKGTVAHLKAPAESVRRAAETARPAWLVFPRYEAGAPTRVTPVGRARAFMRIAENAFNYSVLGEAGFDALAALAGRARAFEFGYSVLDEAIVQFAALEPSPP